MLYKLNFASIVKVFFKKGQRMRRLASRFLGVKMALLCLCVLGLGVSRASEYALHTDSKLTFKLKKFAMISVEGIFKHFNGSLHLDENAVIKDFFIEVESNSLSTGNAKRDKTALDENFLNAQSYPKITLKFISYTPTELKNGIWHGKVLARLNLHGVSKEVEFVSTFESNSNAPKLTLLGKINSKDFKIKGSMTSSREIRLNLQMKFVEYM